MNPYRSIIQTLLLAVVAVAPIACASNTAGTSHDPLRPVSECLDLSRNPELYTPDNKTVIAKTGPKFYRIDLVNDCGVLNPATLNFKIGAGNHSLHRMCGDLGDQVINADGMPCNVKGVTKIDQQQFRQLEAQAKARR